MSHRLSSDLDSVSSASVSSHGSPAHSHRPGQTPESEDQEEQKHSSRRYAGHSAVYLNSSGSYDYSPTTSGQPSEGNSHRLVKPDSFVPAEVAKSQIRKMEKEMQKMQQKHYQLIKEMDQNYANIEREMHDRYAEFISKWKEQVRTRISQYKSAVDAALAEKNALREDAENTISSLEEKVTKLTKEQNALLQRYSQELSQKDAAKEQAISDLQTTYERQIDSLVTERLTLVHRVEEVQAETNELEIRNEQLTQRIAEYEMAVIELTKKYEGEVSLVRDEMTACEHEVLDLMLSNLVYAVNERVQIKDKYMQEKARFEMLKTQRNVEKIKVQTFLVEFEQRHGRKCEAMDKDPMKPHYARFYKLGREMETVRKTLLDLRGQAMREGVKLEDARVIGTPRRVRSISPQLALNLSLDSYTGTPTSQDLDRSRMDQSYIEGSDVEGEVREKPKLDISRIKGKVTPRSVSQAQSMVADSIITTSAAGEVRKLKAEVERLKGELSAFRMKVVTTAPDFATVYHQEIQALQSELDLAKQRAAQDRRKPTFKEVEDLRSENARLKDEIASYHNQPSKITDETTDAEDLSRRVDYLGSENRSFKSQVEKLRAELEASSAACEELTQSRESFQARVQGLESENRKLMQEVTDLRPVPERLKVIETESSRQIRDLESRSALAISQANSTNERLEQEIDRLEQEKVELEAQLDSAREQQSSLQTHLNVLLPLQQQLSALTQSHAELKRTYQQKEQDLKASLLQRRDLYNQLADLRGKIRVVCRVRPLNALELQETAAERIINIQDEFTLACEVKPGTVSPFTYDAVFAEAATQEEVFDDTKKLIQSAVDGYNVCIFAYGQTGSGKTYTILGDEEHPGITPRAINELFALLDRFPKPFVYKVSCYMVELYLDHLVDLFLSKKVKQQPLTIRKDSTGRIYIPEATVITVTSARELHEVFQMGSQQRHTSDTRMNDSSSRSHLIFSILLEISNPDTDLNRIGKLSLVDLAGSERVKKTGATAERLKEGQAISVSLTALGNVITALVEGAPHVPYRENKLTMLMSDSLGGDVRSHIGEDLDVREHFSIGL